jgi:hypothetical protein
MADQKATAFAVASSINTSMLIPLIDVIDTSEDASGTNKTAVPSVLFNKSLDTLYGSAQGNVLYRGTSAWAALAPGTNGTVLTSGGASANPSWGAAGGAGTVTSVATGIGLTGGPVTTAGTISIAAGGVGTTQLAAGAVHYANIQGETGSTLLGNPAGFGANVSEITLGAGLAFSGTTLTATGGAGTVTSVATGTGLTGGTITTTGTVSLATIPGKSLLGNTSGGTATPSVVTI